MAEYKLSNSEIKITMDDNNIKIQADDSLRLTECEAMTAGLLYGMACRYGKDLESVIMSVAELATAMEDFNSKEDE